MVLMKSTMVLVKFTMVLVKITLLLVKSTIVLVKSTIHALARSYCGGQRTSTPSSFAACSGQ